jgi:two-component system NtrC family response regulator
LRNSRQLLKLVNQLLDFSRLESGGLAVINENKDMKEFVSAVLDSFSLIAKNKKIKLSFNLAHDVAAVSIDAGKMERILFNLVGNAFKFTPEKGEITVSLEQTMEGSVDSSKENHIKITVKDTGIGIKEEHLETVFNRFMQTDTPSAKQQKGAGIGLAYAKELVEIMGGHINVESSYGKGSTFTISVPAEKVGLSKEIKKDSYQEDELYLVPEIELSDILQKEKKIKEKVSGKNPLVLIVDDNPDVLHYISSAVKREYDFITAEDGKAALNRLRKIIPDIILCDVMMPEMDGFEFLKQVKSKAGLKRVPFLFLTARASNEMIVEGLDEGADDYIVKPFNSLELLARIKSLLRIRALLGETVSQKKKINGLTRKLEEKYHYNNIVGKSPVMRKMYQLLDTIKTSDATVLVTGETGTGKELIANAIHYNSQRKDKSIIYVNCGAIPRELMESEFFGNVKGAFTGADDNRKGYFETADKGTLFLDEVGEMDKELQVKLLRVFEHGEITPVGASKPTKVDVRLIAATNKDLREEIKNGNFREDLYYRFHVIPIHVPPLRERKDDIPLLIEHFLKTFQTKHGKEATQLSEKDLSFFMNYSYPGNVRELANMVERLCLGNVDTESVLNSTLLKQVLTTEDYDFDAFLSSSNPLKVMYQEAKDRVEKDFIVHTLEKCNRDFKKTTEMLAISRSYLYKKLKEFEIRI